MWLNFTEVKYDSKISNIYHQKKFRKRLQSWNFVKKRIQHRCFLVNIVKLLRAPVLKNIRERLFERVDDTWAKNVTSNIGREEDIFSKTKQKSNFKSQLDEKNLPFNDALDHFVLLCFSNACLRRRLPYIIKDNSSQAISNSLTNEGLILDHLKY